ncbi:hypothetical protein DITRI_Ditri17bG0029900 [Diplodiscus trichospermus]
MIEAYAMLRALDFASNMGYCNFELEGDALTIIRKLQSNTLDLSHIWIIIEDGKLKLDSFTSCKIMHTAREGKWVAHHLAKFGLNVSEDHVWMEDIPNFVIDSVIMDYPI